MAGEIDGYGPQARGAWRAEVAKEHLAQAAGPSSKRSLRPGFHKSLSLGVFFSRKTRSGNRRFLRARNSGFGEAELASKRAIGERVVARFF